MSGILPGDTVRAYPVDLALTRITGTVVGMTNASGELRICVETTDGRLYWCRAATALVLKSKYRGLTASRGGGGTDEQK